MENKIPMIVIVLSVFLLFFAILYKTQSHEIPVLYSRVSIHKL